MHPWQTAKDDSYTSCYYSADTTGGTYAAQWAAVKTTSGAMSVPPHSVLLSAVCNATKYGYLWGSAFWPPTIKFLPSKWWNVVIADENEENVVLKLLLLLLWNVLVSSTDATVWWKRTDRENRNIWNKAVLLWSDWKKKGIMLCSFRQQRQMYAVERLFSRIVLKNRTKKSGIC